ncbi:glutamyl-tRNA reductase, partial [Staphylococcus aureus]
LKGIVDAILRERQIAAATVSEQLPAEILAHNEWISKLCVVPMIRCLHREVMAIQGEPMESIDRKLPGLTRCLLYTS